MGASPEGDDVALAFACLSETEIGALLASFGYAWSLREGGWCECLVERAGERWPGQGLTRAAALRDALGKMLPSALARHLLGRVRAAPPDETDAAPVTVLRSSPIR